MSLIFRLAVLLLLRGGAAAAAEDCCASNPSFPGDCARARASGVQCARFRSRFDGERDHYFLRLPPGYDGTRPVPLFLFYRANAQGGAAFSDPRLYDSIGRRWGGIAVFHTNRCDEPCTGRNGPMTGPALEDARELTNQLASAFRISHAFVVGTSRGGVLGLRLLGRHPGLFSGVIAAVPALCMASDRGPPGCEGSYYEEATREIYAAAEVGRFDDRLLVAVIGARDENAAIVAGNRHLAGLMRGKPWYRLHEADGGHENYLGGAYNERALGRFEWLVSNPAAPTLERDLEAYLAAHPRKLAPEPGWRLEVDYLTAAVREQARRGAPAAFAAPPPGARTAHRALGGWSRRRMALAAAAAVAVLGGAALLRRRRRKSA